MVKKLSFVLLSLILSTTTIFAYTTISGNMSGITLSSGTYHVTGDLFVNDGTTFTLNPGVVLKFATGKDLTVYGTLHAIGLNSPFIFFTSQNDDTVGETLPISTGNPQPGDWEGILFDGTTTNDGICAMKYCCVKFGGSSSGTILSNIKLEESDVCSIEYTITRFSEVHGIGIDTCSPDIVYNYVDHNLQSGIYIEGTCLSTISGNNIFDNSTSGLYISTYSSAPTVTSNTIDNNDPSVSYTHLTLPTN